LKSRACSGDAERSCNKLAMLKKVNWATVKKFFEAEGEKLMAEYAP